MDQYAQHFKKLADLELLKILQHEEEYEADALEAAEKELKSRELDESEMQQLQVDLLSREELDKRRTKAIEEGESKLIEFISKIFQGANPFQSDITRAQRIIRSITLILLLMSLYSIYKEISIMVFLLTEEAPGSIDDLLFYLAVFLYLPISTILFWKRHFLGWILVVYHAVYVAAFSLYSLYFQIAYSGGIDILIDRLNRYSTSSILLSIVLWSMIFRYLLNEEVRSVFKISAKRLKLALLFALIYIITVYILFFI